MKPHKQFLYQIYLLELENYHLGRYIGLWRDMLHGPKGDFRKPIVWTKKLIVVVAGAVFIWALDMLAFAWVLELLRLPTLLMQLLLWVVAYLTLVYVFFVYLTVTVWLLRPLDKYLKRQIIDSAREKLKERKAPLTIIGITGSYGKTSMKAALKTVLSEGKRVLATPDSVNTPVGVSRFVLDKLTDQTEVLIVEMGAYTRGDIADLCSITKPDIAVLTGINEAHLERFGSLEHTIAAKFEIVEHANEDALLIINGDDQRVRENAAAYSRGRTVAWFGNFGNAQFLAEAVHFDPEEPGMRFVLSGPDGRVGEFLLPFLAPYVAELVQAAATAAAHLGMSYEQIATGIMKLKPVEHRLELKSRENNVWIIDDSYNGNPEGVRAAIGLLEQLQSRRRIYVTPGLVEMGERSDEVHREIGAQLAGAAEQIALVRNSVTPHIADGLQAKGFDPDNIVWFDSAQEMHQKLPGTFRGGDVVLFQNDWPENYR